MAEENEVQDSATSQRVFTNRGPRDRVPVESQRVGTVEAHDKSSSGKGGRPAQMGTYERAPARNRRIENLRKKKAAEAAESAAERETAEVGPEETQAVTMKPEARKAASGKRTTKK